MKRFTDLYKIPNTEIIHVLDQYTRLKETKLFGITGDLDNLGIYVARNGRPKAENLVDLYNHMIFQSVTEWQQSCKDIKSISFIPAGEEILIVGLTSNSESVENFFKTIRNRVMQKMKRQGYVRIGDTAASFGGKVFDNSLDTMINFFLNSYDKQGESEETLYKYFNLLEKIRSDLAVRLDAEKFKDILNGKYPIPLRQMVLTQMLMYKTTTKHIIRNLNILDEQKVANLIDLLGSDYGIKEGTEIEISRLIRELQLY